MTRETTAITQHTAPLPLHVHPGLRADVRDGRKRRKKWMLTTMSWWQRSKDLQVRLLEFTAGRWIQAAVSACVTWSMDRVGVEFQHRRRKVLQWNSSLSTPVLFTILNLGSKFQREHLLWEDKKRSQYPQALITNKFRRAVFDHFIPNPKREWEKWTSTF